MSFFGKNIKKIRNVKGLTQQQFAELFDLKRATLGAYEEGRSEPRIETIITVANHFSITTDDLLTRELTVNQLLRFKDDMQAVIEKSAKDIYDPIPCITKNCEAEFIALNRAETPPAEGHLADFPQVILPIEDTENRIAYTVQTLEMSIFDQGLFPGDMVICKSTEIDKLVQMHDQMVLVLTDDALILRRVSPSSSEEKLILTADHVRVQEISLELSDIVKGWKVVGYFADRAPEIQTHIGTRLTKLEEKIRGM